MTLTVGEIIVSSLQVAHVHVRGNVGISQALGHAKAVPELIQASTQHRSIDCQQNCLEAGFYTRVKMSQISKLNEARQ